MKNSNATTIHLIRHGTTEHNEKRIFQGHSDGPLNHLNEKGVNEAEEYSKKFRDVPIVAIFSSDLTRSRQTAEIVARECNLTISTSPLLRGKRMGQYEGMSIEKYREQNREALDKLRSLPEAEQWKHKIRSDMENNEEVINRLLSFLRKASETFSGKEILVVTHGGTMRNLLFFLGWAKQHELRVGSVNSGAFITITFDGNKFQLEKVVGIVKNSNNFGEKRDS